MKIDKQQKADLKELVESRGYKILEAMLQEKRATLWTSLESFSVWDEKTQNDIFATQNFIKGMQFLLSQAKGLSQDVVKKDLDPTK